MMASATSISMSVKPLLCRIVRDTQMQLAAAVAHNAIRAGGSAALMHAELEGRHLAAREQIDARRRALIVGSHPVGIALRLGAERELISLHLEIDGHVERQGARTQHLVFERLPLIAVEGDECIMIAVEFHRELAALIRLGAQDAKL